MNDVDAAGVVKKPDESTWLVTSSPAFDAVDDSDAPLENVNCAVGESRANPAPPNTNGDTRPRAGSSYRSPPSEYHAGTCAVPTTLTPSNEDRLVTV